MESRQRLQQRHTQPYSLNSVQYSQPQPGELRQVGTEVACPRKVVADSRHRPEHLAPPRCTETDGKDGQQPRVDLSVSRQTPQEDRPDADEEDDNQNGDRPHGNVGVAP